MKKLVSAAIMAGAMALPMIGTAMASEDNIGIVNQHFDRIVNINDRGRLVCNVHRGDRLELGRRDGNRTAVTVLTGPCTGKKGHIANNAFVLRESTIPVLLNRSVPNDNPQYIISMDDVRVMGNDRIACVVNKEVKVEILAWDGEYREIQIMEGPKKGCKGRVFGTRVVRAPVIDQKVFAAGRWGDAVPVFKDRGSFFRARHSMDKNKHYRDQLDNVACKLKVGSVVKFNAFRDWGVGEIKAGNCEGWIDRGVIR